MRVVVVIIFGLTSIVMTTCDAAVSATTLRHDDVIVTSGRCLVRCLTLLQVRDCSVAQLSRIHLLLP